MFSSLFKHSQRLFRLQIKPLSSVIDSVKNNRDTGIVKRFSKDKGFGFIKRDSDGNDIFVHFQSILGTGFKTLEVNKERTNQFF
jgi:cold shock CspA family protein